ncbi:MAG: methylenetetrahydrofolate reductase C-terminal domain-containing protein [Candidatus Thiodiazotropha sp.]
MFAPLVRLLGAKPVLALLHPMERTAKGLMFDCHECGQCVLSATGMACPMNCAKEMRNGPCGGVRDDGHCEVKPEMRCVYRRKKTGQLNLDSGYQRELRPGLPAPGGGAQCGRFAARLVGEGLSFRTFRGHC